MKEILRSTREGFEVIVLEFDDNRITFTADADIDADGANGQNGERPAYMKANRGSEHLANGGMRALSDGTVVGDSGWWQDIVIVEGGKPKEFPGGVIASKTAYRWLDKPANDPAAYVDSETIPYIAIPPEVRNKTRGIVMGAKVKCFNKSNGKEAWGMVADIAPRLKFGEVSIEMARQLGMNPSPRSGGESRPVIEYTIYAGEHAEIQGKLAPLVSAKGVYKMPVEGDVLDGTLSRIHG